MIQLMRKYLTNELPDRKVILENGQEYLWFSGTDYLGMGHNEAFRSNLNEGFHAYGTHFGSSRNNSLQLNIYAEAEKSIRKFTGAPAALTVSSGMWAGQLVMKEIERILLITSTPQSIEQIQYHYGPGVHPALWGKDYSSGNKNWTKWAYETIHAITESSDKVAHIICTDSVGSPWAEEFDFAVFNDLPIQKNTFLIVDDSHGLGASGQSGNGSYQKLSSIKNAGLLVVASLNKAMGIPAGMILADENISSLLRTSPWFSGASPCAPAYCFALKKSLDQRLYQTAFHFLKNNISYFQDRILDSGMFSCIENYPVFCSNDSSLFPFLLDNGIMASCFPYPLATDPPVTRLAISALHQKEDLDQLAEVFIKFRNL